MDCAARRQVPFESGSLEGRTLGRLWAALEAPCSPTCWEVGCLGRGRRGLVRGLGGLSARGSAGEAARFDRGGRVEGGARALALLAAPGEHLDHGVAFDGIAAFDEGVREGFDGLGLGRKRGLQCHFNLLF